MSLGLTGFDWVLPVFFLALLSFTEFDRPFGWDGLVFFLPGFYLVLPSIGVIFCLVEAWLVGQMAGKMSCGHSIRRCDGRWMRGAGQGAGRGAGQGAWLAIDWPFFLPSFVILANMRCGRPPWHRIFFSFFFLLPSFIFLKLPSLPRRNGWYRMEHGFTGFYWVLPTSRRVILQATWFYWVLLGFIGFSLQWNEFNYIEHVFTGFDWVWLGFTRFSLQRNEFNHIEHVFTGFYWVSLGFPYNEMSSTTLNTLLLGFTGFH